MAAFSLQFKQAIKFAEAKKVVLPDEYYGLTMRSRATTISGLASLSQIEFVVDQMNKTLSEGKTFEDFKKSVKDGNTSVVLADHRLSTIFRTNIQTAYNFGRFEEQERAKDTRPFRMYDAVNDSRTRPSHAQLDNTILPENDKFWHTHYPPLGFNCRCIVISLTKEQAEKRGISKNKPNVNADEGFGLNAAEFKASLEAVLDKKMADLEIKFKKSSKTLSIIKNKLYNDAIAMERLNSIVNLSNITGPVKDQYMNILSTLSLRDPSVGQLPVALLNSYIQSGSDKIKSFLSDKSQIASNLVAAEWMTAAFRHLEAISTNKTSKILRGDSAVNKSSILSVFEVGSVVRLVSPLSFTKDENAAKIKSSVGGVIFHINNGKGHGIDVIAAGGTTNQALREQEVILTPGTSVIVNSVEPRIDGYTHITMSVTEDAASKEY